MALQNIGASNSDDAFYRYKMPRMITKIEGRGNGIKTNIVNMVDIAKALARPASYTTKYFGCELGAQSKFDEKSGTSLINGAHETAKLAGLLENFIKKYVQCYGCGNPETEIVIAKTEMITLKCAACGFVSDVDMRDKLTTFILKNPPEPKKGSKEKKAMRRAEKERLREGEAADEQKKLQKGARKKAAAAAAPTSSKVSSKKTPNANTTRSDEDRHSSSPSKSHNGDVSGDDDDDVQWKTDTSLEAAQKRIREQLNAVTAEMVMLSTAEPKREKKPTDYEKLVSEIKGKLCGGCTPSELQSFLESAPGGAAEEVITALFEALFDGVGKGFAKEVGKKKDYIAAGVAKVEGSQMIVLRAVESFCGKASGDAVKEVAMALKVLYDADLVEEEAVVQWYGEGKSEGARMWKNVKPFVEWLQNVESESESEEE